MQATAFPNSMMFENYTDEDLASEIGRKNFVRAAQIAVSLGFPQEEVKKLQLEALWQMAALNRNARGTKSLAQEYGISKQQLKQEFEERTGEMRAKGDTKVLAPCYDIATGEYMTFEEWLAYYMKNWERL